MEAACKKAKIAPPLRFHELKHTYASLALDAGLTMWFLSKNTGTSMTTLEKHYGHRSDKALKKAVEDNIPSFGVDETNVVNIS